MESVIELMEESVILTAQDIARFRQYIDRKYAKEVPRIKAEILADVIHRMIEPHLEGIERSYRKTIKKALFSNNQTQQKDHICKKDIFNELVLLDVEETKLMDMAWGWLKANVWSRIAYDAVMDLVKGLRSPAPVPIMASFETVEPIEMPLLESKGNSGYWVSVFMGLIILTLGAWSWHLLSDMAHSVPGESAVSRSVEKPDGLPSASVTQGYEESVLYEVSVSKSETAAAKTDVAVTSSGNNTAYGYVPFDEADLRAYLHKRNSLLAEAPYFQTIVETAKAYNLDPRLLFAIAGQEQGLVNKNKTYALKAANNPFNVYGSWVKYNTSIEDSSKIVCNTLVKRLSKKPKGMDELDWINKKYASDPNWSKGVRRYYKTLVKVSK